MTLHLTLNSDVRDSFRFQQIAGMFDLPLPHAGRLELAACLPAADEPWTIGAIVGPSGSGKTTVARAAFGITRHRRRWPRDRAVIDALGRLPIRSLLALLTAVGLNSPPAWLRPYHLLSTGEQFRCDLARELVSSPRARTNAGRPFRAVPVGRERPSYNSQLNLLVIDEFTSHLDRDTARSASFAVQQFLRRRAADAGDGRLETCPARFVAVTCHEDILPWLVPDWVLRMPRGTLDRGPLAAPPLSLRCERCENGAWDDFRMHHYLSGRLARGATSYLARFDGRPAAFCAVLGQIGHRGRKRITRLVTLPQFQGLGIGMRLAEHVCRRESQRGFRVSIATSHPAVIAACRRSPRWRYLGIKRYGGTPQRIGRRRLRGSTGRIVAAFEYIAECRVQNAECQKRRQPQLE